ncbi:MAG: peptidoglycan editing factor PgeF [Candidatus Aminicenantes bacterium]|nr:peptidoglycan editing factor PgeF [Candidatus Aminicenantes bacterium]
MNRKGGKRFLISPLLADIPGLVHGFGMKGCGFRDAGGIGGKTGFRPVTLDQVHSDAVIFFARRPKIRKRGDALVTDRLRLLLAVKTADCLPILLADPEGRVAAAVHCGWRGTASRLAEKTVSALQRKYGCRPSSLRAALGPCIGPRCFEVGEDVRRAFRESGLSLRDFAPRRGHPGKSVLDLAGANRRQLIRAGLKKRNIELVSLCTHCRPEFFSYRRDPEAAGRQINFIGFAVR